MTSSIERNWSGRRDSNPRPRPWQGRALPLSYTRILTGWLPSAPSYAKSNPLQQRQRQRQIARIPGRPARTIGRSYEMPSLRRHLFAYLDHLGIPALHHDASAAVSPSSNPRRCAAWLPGRHTTNLFLKDKKGRSVLWSRRRGCRPIELKSLHNGRRRLGTIVVRISRSDARTAGRGARIGHAVRRLERLGRPDHPCLPAAGRIAAPARTACRSTFSSRATLRWSMTALRDGHRLIGMIQPDAVHSDFRRIPTCSKSGAPDGSPNWRSPATAGICCSSPVLHGFASSRSSMS